MITNKGLMMENANEENGPQGGERESICWEIYENQRFSTATLSWGNSFPAHLLRHDPSPFCSPKGNNTWTECPPGFELAAHESGECGEGGWMYAIDFLDFSETNLGFPMQAPYLKVRRRRYINQEAKIKAHPLADHGIEESKTNNKLGAETGAQNQNETAQFVGIHDITLRIMFLGVAWELAADRRHTVAWATAAAAGACLGGGGGEEGGPLAAAAGGEGAEEGEEAAGAAEVRAALLAGGLGEGVTIFGLAVREGGDPLPPNIQLLAVQMPSGGGASPAPGANAAARRLTLNAVWEALVRCPAGAGSGLVFDTLNPERAVVKAASAAFLAAAAAAGAPGPAPALVRRLAAPGAQLLAVGGRPGRRRELFRRLLDNDRGPIDLTFVNCKKTISWDPHKINEIATPYKLKVEVIKGKNIKRMDLKIASDPYVVLTVGEFEECTKVKKAKKNPVWNEVFYFPVNRDDSKLKCVVYDHNDFSRDKRIGYFELDIRSFTVGEAPTADGIWITLESPSGPTSESASPDPETKNETAFPEPPKRSFARRSAQKTADLARRAKAKFQKAPPPPPGPTEEQQGDAPPPRPGPGPGPKGAGARGGGRGALNLRVSLEEGIRLRVTRAAGGGLLRYLYAGRRGALAPPDPRGPHPDVSAAGHAFLADQILDQEQLRDILDDLQSLKSGAQAAAAALSPFSRTTGQQYPAAGALLLREGRVFSTQHAAAEAERLVRGISATLTPAIRAEEEGGVVSAPPLPARDTSSGTSLNRAPGSRRRLLEVQQAARHLLQRRLSLRHISSSRSSAFSNKDGGERRLAALVGAESAVATLDQAAGPLAAAGSLLIGALAGTINKKAHRFLALNILYLDQEDKETVLQIGFVEEANYWRWAAALKNILVPLQELPADQLSSMDIEGEVYYKLNPENRADTGFSTVWLRLDAEKGRLAWAPYKNAMRGNEEVPLARVTALGLSGDNPEPAPALLHLTVLSAALQDEDSLLGFVASLDAARFCQANIDMHIESTSKKEGNIPIWNQSFVLPAGCEKGHLGQGPAEKELKACKLVVRGYRHLLPDVNIGETKLQLKYLNPGRNYSLQLPLARFFSSELTVHFVSGLDSRASDDRQGRHGFVLSVVPVNWEGKECIDHKQKSKAVGDIGPDAKIVFNKQFRFGDDIDIDDIESFLVYLKFAGAGKRRRIGSVNLPAVLLKRGRSAQQSFPLQQTSAKQERQARAFGSGTIHVSYRINSIMDEVNIDGVNIETSSSKNGDAVLAEMDKNRNFQSLQSRGVLNVSARLEPVRISSCWYPVKIFDGSIRNGETWDHSHVGQTQCKGLLQSIRCCQVSDTAALTQTVTIGSFALGQGAVHCSLSMEQCSGTLLDSATGVDLMSFAEEIDEGVLLIVIYENQLRLSPGVWPDEHALTSTECRVPKYTCKKGIVPLDPTIDLEQILAPSGYEWATPEWQPDSGWLYGETLPHLFAAAEDGATNTGVFPEEMDLGEDSQNHVLVKKTPFRRRKFQRCLSPTSAPKINKELPNPEKVLVFDFEELTKFCIVSESTLMIETQRKTGDAFMLIVGPCPAWRIYSLINEKKSISLLRKDIKMLFGKYRSREWTMEQCAGAAKTILLDIQDIFELDKRMKNQNTTQSSIDPEDPHKSQQPSTLLVTTPQMIRLRAYVCEILSLGLVFEWVKELKAGDMRRWLQSEFDKVYTTRQVGDTGTLQLQTHGGLSQETEVDRELEFMLNGAQLASDIMLEIIICAPALKEEHLLEAKHEVVNMYARKIMGRLGEFLSTQAAFNRITGLEVLQILRIFLQDDGGAMSTVFTELCGWGVHPRPNMSLFFDSKRLFSLFASRIELEMTSRCLSIQKVFQEQVAPKISSSSEKVNKKEEILVPWEVKEMVTDSHLLYSNLPEEVMRQMMPFLDTANQYLPFNPEVQGAVMKAMFNALSFWRNRLLATVLGIDWTDPSISLKLVEFLCSLCNDMWRMVTSHLNSLEFDYPEATTIASAQLQVARNVLLTLGLECIENLTKVVMSDAEEIFQRMWVHEISEETEEVLSDNHGTRPMEELTEMLTDFLLFVKPKLEAFYFEKLLALCADTVVFLYLKSLSDFADNMHLWWKRAISIPYVSKIDKDAADLSQCFLRSSSSKKSGQGLYDLKIDYLTEVVTFLKLLSFRHEEGDSLDAFLNYFEQVKAGHPQSQKSVFLALHMCVKLTFAHEAMPPRLATIIQSIPEMPPDQIKASQRYTDRDMYFRLFSDTGSDKTTLLDQSGRPRKKGAPDMKAFFLNRRIWRKNKAIASPTVELTVKVEEAAKISRATTSPIPTGPTGGHRMEEDMKIRAFAAVSFSNYGLHEKTGTAQKSNNPKWNSSWTFQLGSIAATEMTVSLYNRRTRNAGRGEMVGSVTIPLSGLGIEKNGVCTIDDWFQIPETNWKLKIAVKKSKI